MKHGKRLTMQMKRDLQRYDKTIKVEDWLYTKATSETLEIVHRETGERRVFKW